MDENNNFHSQKAEGAYDYLCELEHFIDSMEEPMSEDWSEDLTTEIQRWREHYIKVIKSGFQINLRDVESVARHFAEWQKERLLDKVCRYLYHRLDNGRKLTSNLIDDMRKVMEE